jgi:hypothetical protein
LKRAPDSLGPSQSRLLQNPCESVFIRVEKSMGMGVLHGLCGAGVPSGELALFRRTLSLGAIPHNSLSARPLLLVTPPRKLASFRTNLRCGGAEGLTRPPAATRTTIAERNVIPADAGKRKKAKKGCSPAVLGWGTPRHSRGRLCYMAPHPLLTFQM